MGACQVLEGVAEGSIRADGQAELMVAEAALVQAALAAVVEALAVVGQAVAGSLEADN